MSKGKKALLFILGGGLVIAALTWIAATGVYLLSMTDYSYWNTVGGATLIGLTLGIFCSFIAVAEDL